MTLYFYFARKFAFILAGLFGVFLALFGLLEMMEVLRKFGSTEAGFFDILTLTALSIPQGMYTIIPLVVILGTLVLFLGLARSNELLISRASGRSALKTLIAPILVAMALGVIAITIFNPIVAATSRQYEVLAMKHKNQNASVLSISREGLWLRQGTEEGQTVIRATRANLDGTELFNVTFLGFTNEGVHDYRIEAESARLVPGAWITKNIKEWHFGETGNPEQDATRSASKEIPSNLTREEIRNGFGNPSSIAIWELPAFINHLE
ncbi:MAG: LptF/LptG family permease, partial [Paracoccaceae bacterium]